MVVLFLAIDVLWMTYNQGIMTRAAETAARSASLYWIDIETFDPDVAPATNIRLDPERVQSVVRTFSPMILSAGGNENLTPTIAQLDEDGTATALAANAAPAQQQDGVVVNFTFPRRFSYVAGTLGGLIGVANEGTRATAASVTEVDLDITP